MEQIINPSYIRSILEPRRADASKHDFGQALLIAGTSGKMGAAVMASKACLRAGCGRLTTHVPRRGEIILQTSIPEAMVSLDKNEDFWTEIPNLNYFNAIGIGPGIGKRNEAIPLLKSLFQINSAPIVLDADAINLVAESNELKVMIPENAILTPHSGEFKRLIGCDVAQADLREKQKEFSMETMSILVHKSHRTTITDSVGNVYINTTGNVGLAKAGTGDVLTGIILGLLAQGYSPLNAAIIGVYIHGLAADCAVKKINERSLLATDVVEYLSEAFNQLSLVDG